ncbi:MAG: hypothetical protein EXR79_14720 [Myxococcales bacterium]|nr:hypothetical protein [Myxococcales bacterium]
MPAAAALWACLALAPRCVWAVDPAKAAAAMAQKAAQAYEAGDHARAAQLYLEAARTDPKRPEYLYGAARSEQIAGLADKAEAHFKAFAAAPGGDPAMVEKARARIDELRSAGADERGQSAEAALRRGDARLAAQLWVEAANLAPRRPVYRFRAGSALADAGMLDAARPHLERFVAEAPPDAPELPRARLLLEAPPPKPAPVAEAPAPKPPAPMTVVPKSTAPSARTTWPAWAAASLGVALGGTGAALFLGALDDRRSLDTALSVRSDAGRITALSYREARDWGDDIAAAKTRASMLVGLGTAATSAGLGWLWWDRPAAALLVPGPSGARLAMAWTF